ncbi:hypothetical protein GQ464_002000 [Rhodocaloribacter litoris]|uniref:hypothetical protein n=1 Tax=Rhodocaloribacter litoris TaxID=2558931 RepID=UPI001E5692AA|nr:hypothetical protein [Rhodocaloribacter litoris]QXD15742.1 hypothetical protein GQ464_002000 [Rhodocaloribacter litoris]
MGPTVPVPVPKPVTEALTGVEVRETDGEPAAFTLTFTFDSKSALTTVMLLLGELAPLFRAILVATVRGTPHVLMDGLVTDQQIAPDVQTGKATLTLAGSDLTVAMDQIDFTGIPYPGMPFEARVALIVAKYAVYGMIPLVIPTLFLDVPIPVERIPTHRGTDLNYVRMMAREAGYTFYIVPGPAPGTNVAYWGPEARLGVPQPALNVGMDGFTNVESINFRFTGGEQVLPVVFIQEPFTRAPIPIPIPGIDLLKPPLGLLAGLPRIELMNHTANMNPAQAIQAGLARASRSADVVQGSGSLDVLRYGHVLRARGLVGVRGTGDAFNGLYYVKSVTHRLKRGEYKQDFTLVRDGLLPTVPRVPP